MNIEYRAKITRIADHWRAGGRSYEDALERLAEALIVDARLDARDREALACVIETLFSKDRNAK
jgi:hypothetical protein